MYILCTWGGNQKVTDWIQMSIGIILKLIGPVIMNTLLQKEVAGLIPHRTNICMQELHIGLA